LARLRHYRRLKKFATFAASCSLESAVRAATSPIPWTLETMAAQKFVEKDESSNKTNFYKHSLEKSHRISIKENSCIFTKI